MEISAYMGHNGARAVNNQAAKSANNFIVNYLRIK